MLLLSTYPLAMMDVKSESINYTNILAKFKLRWEAGPDEIINQVTDSIRVSQTLDFYLLPSNPIVAWSRDILRFY
jgi:hypothetical protein